MTSPDVNTEPTPALPVNAAARRPWRRLAVGLFVALAGIAVSALFSWLLLAHEQKLAEVQFMLDAGKRIEALQRAVVDRLEAEDMVAVFFAGSRLVERGEFRAFTAPLIEGHPGLQTLAWVPRIPTARRETHEQAVRGEGFAKYEIGQYDARGRLVPAGKRDEYYPILFIEPLREGRSLMGLDLGSNEACRAAIRQAMATGRQAAFVCSPLDNNETDRNLLYVVKPATNETPDTAQRPADQPEIDGFVLGVFRVGSIVETSLNFFTPVGIDIYISAPPNADGKAPVYTRLSPLRIRDEASKPGDASPTHRVDGLHLTGRIDVANLPCTVDCVPMASYLARQQTWGPLGVLLAGLVITGLLVAHLYVLTAQKARVEELVAERTGELAESERQFHEEQRLLREVLDLHERDRKLVAYEIHDGLAQQLAGAVYKFQSVERLRDEQPEAAREVFDEAVRLLREAMAETRRLISGLRPPVLDESGAVAAIECLIAESRHQGCPEIEFVHELELARLAPPLESALFRIVQECLTNACRYSRSEKVRVELRQTDGRVRVEVRDWGVGFNPAEVQSGHFGLHGIRERARLLGGSATIQTAPQQGTCISVELPVVLPAENGGTRGEFL